MRSEPNYEHIANETSYQESRIEATIEEKVQTACKRSLQDRIQVLCMLSIMFQGEKDAIHENMKRRKLDNSA